MPKRSLGKGMPKQKLPKRSLGKGKPKEDCNCNEVVPPNEEGCCRRSHLRDEGIKRTNIPGVYFADANLICVGEGGCQGDDKDTIYEWGIIVISGNPSLVGSTIKEGNDRIQVAGTGTFDLRVRVTFRCHIGRVIQSCVRTATVRFTQ